MAISKSAKIWAEMERVKAKINEQQARLKELEQKHREAENEEIVDIVRGMSVSLEELPLVLQRLRDGGEGADYGDPTMTEEAPAPEPTIEPGEGFSEEGNLVTRDLLYDEHTNKQFITVQTSGGNTFYIVIDYDKPVDEEGEQYETYFFSVVDEADLLAAAEAAGVEQAVCSCSEKCEAGAVNTDCAVCSVNMSKCVGVEPEPEPTETEEPATEEAEPETGGNMGMLLAVLAVALVGGGAAFYFKVLRPKQQKAAAPQEDYGDELTDYDEPDGYGDEDDDGPPWDEEDDDGEEADK